eukprot:352622-Chlamydomonas_euryale.AAC.8
MPDALKVPWGGCATMPNALKVPWGGCAAMPDALKVPPTLTLYSLYSLHWPSWTQELPYLLPASHNHCKDHH